MIIRHQQAVIEGAAMEFARNNRHVLWRCMSNGIVKLQGASDPLTAGTVYAAAMLAIDLLGSEYGHLVLAAAHAESDPISIHIAQKGLLRQVYRDIQDGAAIASDASFAGVVIALSSLCDDDEEAFVTKVCRAEPIMRQWNIQQAAMSSGSVAQLLASLMGPRR